MLVPFAVVTHLPLDARTFRQNGGEITIQLSPWEQRLELFHKTPRWLVVDADDKLVYCPEAKTARCESILTALYLFRLR
ncbi:MAG TPA: hypothetical protein VGW37_18365 [Terriglobia bacterium]|nr:hypothetical protein [Terriglobia bacterium]